MSPQARDFWQRALRAIETAQATLSGDPDAAASRAYYAAFYAVSAWFSLGGRKFKRHSALEAAVHRDLVQGGLWPQALGADYSFLLRMRDTGDYGGARHVSVEEAEEAVAAARRIIATVKKDIPEDVNQ